MKRWVSKHKLILSLIILILFIILFIFFAFPNTAWLKTKNPEKSNFMILAEQKFGQPISFKYIPYSQIDKDIKNAVYLSEDASFWIHHGIDWHELREVLQDIFRKRKIVRGASTITQQLAKNLFLSPERSLNRKFKEYIYTLSLEYYLPKRRIFELYLNYAQFGKRIFGVEAATRHFFGHSADSVYVLEAAKLAAVLPAPTQWSPNHITPRLEKRIKIILERMLKFHKISEEEYMNAIEQLEEEIKKKE